MNGAGEWKMENDRGGGMKLTKCKLGEIADVVSGVSYKPDGIRKSGIRIPL